MIAPNKIPVTLAMKNLLCKNLGRGRGKRLEKFYADQWPVNQSSGTSVTLDADSPPDVWSLVNI
jgi:hypothetical protein